MYRLCFLIGALVLGAFQVPATCGFQDLEENDSCTLSNNKRGTCKKIPNCPTFEEDSARGDTPDICGFDGIDSTPIVCCRPGQAAPTVTTAPAPKKRVSERMCEKYGELVYIRELDLNFNEKKRPDCGAKEEPLIVGGIKAGLKEFPHMVQIGFGDNPISWSCGGTLISDRWVLSAAHCKEHELKGLAKWARIGDLDHKNDNDGAQPEIVRIADHRNHPNYDGNQLYNDIALFKLERAVRLSSYVRPICLQVDTNLKGETVIATGWGHTVWGGRPSSHLQKVKINVVNNKRCRQAYANSDRKQLPNGILQTSQICAGNEYNKDTCQGDSGGPIQYRNVYPFCTYSQVGVTSFGRGCGGGSPGVYTRVSHYIDWIESVVWPGQ